MFKLNASASTVEYKVVHPAHEVEAKATKLEGAAAIKPDGALVQLRFDNRAFDSGNANRDYHQRQTIEADKFPYTTVKGQVKGFTLPTSFPADVKGTLVGEMEFHGVKNPIPIPVVIPLRLRDPRRGQEQPTTSASTPTRSTARA